MAMLRQIDKLMELHDYLIDAGNKVNSCFSVQILAIFTVQFLHEVFTVFYMYYESMVLNLP